MKAGDAAGQVVELLSVGFFVGDVCDRALRAGACDDALREFVHADFFGSTDVKDLAARGGGLHEPNERVDDVVDMTETSRLRTVAINSQRLVREGCIDEARQDHAVHAHLARADGVEESHDDCGQGELLVIGECEELIDAFGIGVTPASVSRRAHDDVVVFVERDA